MAWENSENSDFPWKYHKYPHIFCPASLVKFGEKWDTLIYNKTCNFMFDNDVKVTINVGV